MCPTNDNLSQESDAYTSKCTRRYTLGIIAVLPPFYYVPSYGALTVHFHAPLMHRILRVHIQQNSMAAGVQYHFLNGGVVSGVFFSPTLALVAML